MTVTIDWENLGFSYMKLPYRYINNFTLKYQVVYTTKNKKTIRLTSLSVWDQHCSFLYI